MNGAPRMGSVGFERDEMFWWGPGSSGSFALERRAQDDGKYKTKAKARTSKGLKARTSKSRNGQRRNTEILSEAQNDGLKGLLRRDIAGLLWVG